jgi:hypothetical protein
MQNLCTCELDVVQCSNLILLMHLAHATFAPALDALDCTCYACCLPVCCCPQQLLPDSKVTPGVRNLVPLALETVGIALWGVAAGAIHERYSDKAQESPWRQALEVRGCCFHCQHTTTSTAVIWFCQKRCACREATLQCPVLCQLTSLAAAAATAAAAARRACACQGCKPKGRPGRHARAVIGRSLAACTCNAVWPNARIQHQYKLEPLVLPVLLAQILPSAVAHTVVFGIV